MEPYKRLVDRRWEDMSARVRELEAELERAKKKAAEAKNIPSRVETEVVVKRVKTVSKPGGVEEVIQSEERIETQSELPFDEQAFLQPGAQAPPDETGRWRARVVHVMCTWCACSLIDRSDGVISAVCKRVDFLWRVVG